MCSRLSIRATEGQVVAKDIRIRAGEILITNKTLDVMWSTFLGNITEPPATLVEYSSLVEDQNSILPGNNGADDITISSCLQFVRYLSVNRGVISFNGPQLARTVLVDDKDMHAWTIEYNITLGCSQC